MSKLDSRIMTVADIARRQAIRHPHKVALQMDGRTTTYRSLDAASNRVANALIADGIRPGDRVAFLGKNSDIYFEIMLGCAKAGAVLTPVNWRLAQPEIVHVLTDCAAVKLFVNEAFAAAAERTIAEHRLAITLHVIASDGGLSDYPAWRDRAPSSDPMIDINEDDVLLQLYTSGTTGRPKGAMLRHRGLVGRYHLQATYGADWYRVEHNDICLVAMPIFHIGGSGWGLIALFNGATGVIVPEFDPRAVVTLIATYHISKMFIVPSALHIILNDSAGGADFGSLRTIFYGSSPIHPQLVERAVRHFGCPFVQMYGLTESSGTIVALAPEDHGGERALAAGKPLPGVEIMICGGDGTQLPPGETGEIVTRSIGNMAGYWRNDVANREVFLPDGWMRTGDAGYVDVDGYLFIRDRVKDLIVSGGENVYPAEVEQVIAAHPEICEVAVIGVPSSKWGEEVRAIAVLEPGSSLDAPALIRWVRERLAGYKTPKQIDFIAALPRNAAGKVLRRTLREPFWGNSERQIN